MPSKNRRPVPPSVQELVNQTHLLARFVPSLRALSWFGIGGVGLKTFTQRIRDIEEEVDALVQLPTLFHDAFSEMDGYSQSPRVPRPLRKRLRFIVRVIQVKPSHY